MYQHDSISASAGAGATVQSVGPPRDARLEATRRASGAVVPRRASAKMGREVRRLAERGGFEPPVEVLTPYNRLAICPVQPLQHLSARGNFPRGPSGGGPGSARLARKAAAGARRPSATPPAEAAAGSARRPRRGARRPRRGGLAAPRPSAAAAGRAARQRGLRRAGPAASPAGDLTLRAATGGQPFFLAPLYVYFLGLTFALAGGSLVAAKVLQVLLGTAAVGLLYAAARPWLGRTAALVGAALLALAGPIVFHEAILLQAALDPFLIALGLFAVSRALQAGRWRDWALAGAALGLFALNRPNALLWGLGLVVALPLARGLSRGGREAAALALGLALGIAPATAAQPRRVGRAGARLLPRRAELYVGNRAEADGTYRRVPGITPDIQGQFADARRVAEEAAGRPLSAREVDAHFRGLAWEWVRAHPLDAARLFLRKLAYVFAAPEISLNYSYAYYALDEPRSCGGWWSGLAPRAAGAPRPRRPAVVGSAGAASSRSAGDGGSRSGRSWCPSTRCPWPSFFVSARYRLPLLVPLAAGAGFALARIVEAARARATAGSPRTPSPWSRSLPSLSGRTASTTAGRRSARSCSSGSWTTARARGGAAPAARGRGGAPGARPPPPAARGGPGRERRGRGGGAAPRALLALTLARREVWGSLLERANSDAIPHLRARSTRDSVPKPPPSRSCRRSPRPGRPGGGGTAGAALRAAEDRRHDLPRRRQHGAAAAPARPRPAVPRRGDGAGPADGGAARGARSWPW